eukprot:4869884-Lingulodinium_polyedra.AAC.1
MARVAFPETAGSNNRVGVIHGGGLRLRPGSRCARAARAAAASRERPERPCCATVPLRCHAP